MPKTPTPLPVRLFVSDFSERDQQAIMRHLTYLVAEACATSLIAKLPESGQTVQILKSGFVLEVL